MAKSLHITGMADQVRLGHSIVGAGNQTSVRPFHFMLNLS